MKDKIFSTLKNVFGFDNFRPNQESIVTSIIGGRDVLAVLPTGAGKSLCFQLPAVIMDGTAIVISPLISLMKDQVDNANKKGIVSVLINSDLSVSESNEVYDKILLGKVKLLYIAPERFEVFNFRDVLQKIKVSAIFIDEAHTIDWGYDFRPAYMKIAHHLKSFTNVPRAAFTASATKETQNDIVVKFGLNSPVMVQASFNRPNLYYSVLQKNDNCHYDALDYINKHKLKNTSGIIYRSTRQKTEDMAEYLSRAGVKCLPFHAGLDTDTKKMNQSLFVNGETKWICATIAFGMGIDVAGIRTVLHADLPKNMEGFYQETGRAGRDGNGSNCILFYHPADIRTIKYFIDQCEDTERQKILSKQLKSMVDYAENDVCRRKSILNYFGENYPNHNCGNCDVCLKKIAAGRFAKKIDNKTLFLKY